VPRILILSAPYGAGHTRAVEAALPARNARELRRHLDTLLAEPELRATLATTARSLRRPEAGWVVAKEMLSLLEQG
jgi:hypothetical protein